MATRDDPNITNDSASNVLRYGSDASHRCRGIPAAGHAELIYLLGVYRTWMGAAAILRDPDVDEALASLMEASDRTATSLMTTLRTYAFQCPAEPVPSPVHDIDRHDAVNAEMEILSQEDWLIGTDTHDADTEEPIANAMAGLTPTQVYAHLRDFSDDVPGYWLLGRLEASTGLQAALAVAVVSGRDTGQRVAQLRTAIALQCEAARGSLQFRIDVINRAHPFLRAAAETIFVEGLDSEIPRLIVVDCAQSSNEQLLPW